MFHGGTNFGFMSGVTPNWDAPYDSKVVTTSYGNFWFETSKQSLLA